MISRILGWTIAIAFGIAAAGALAQHEVVPGTIVLVAALLAFPPIWQLGALSHVPGWLRAVGVVLALVGLGASLPQTSAPASSRDDGSPPKPSQEAAAATQSAKGGAPKEAGATDAPKWTYSDSKDEMRGTTTRFASVESDNLLDFAFPYNGGATGSLTLRERPQDGLNILLAVSKGQFQCHALEGGNVTVKFDDGPLEGFPCYEPSDATPGLLFIGNERRFLHRLRVSRKITVEAQFFEEGPRQLTFETRGLVWR